MNSIAPAFVAIENGAVGFATFGVDITSFFMAFSSIGDAFVRDA